MRVPIDDDMGPHHWGGGEGYGDGVDGAPNGLSAPRWSLSATRLEGSCRLRKSIRNFAAVTRVRLDLAKSALQVHAVDTRGEVVAAPKPARGRRVGFFSEFPRCLAAMEACLSAQVRARLAARAEDRRWSSVHARLSRRDDERVRAR